MQLRLPELKDRRGRKSLGRPREQRLGGGEVIVRDGFAQVGFSRMAKRCKNCWPLRLTQIES